MISSCKYFHSRKNPLNSRSQKKTGQWVTELVVLGEKAPEAKVTIENSEKDTVFFTVN